jgi:NAD(P)-dependent dehydrogenase (short-subunit alcohol dehydrogenase family)
MSKIRWTESDVPDQSGRVAIVTGANTGLGFETARALAGHGARVVLAVRDVEKGKKAGARIVDAVPGADIRVQPLDLADLASIRSAAADIRSAYAHVDLLINNAGVMYTPYSTTADGFETQFGVNFLGHFALTGMLIDKLTKSPGSRVVNLGSLGHRIRARIDFDDLNSERRYSKVAAYGRSKLGCLLFTYALQRKLEATGSSTIAVAAHPGFSDTELIRNSPAPVRVMATATSSLYMQRPALGALPTLRAATDPGVNGGEYYGPSGLGEMRGYPVVVKSSAASHDQAVQSRLWSASEQLTNIRFPH